MSNKPSIYGFCKAGCRWETVHKEDFANSFPFVTENVDSGKLNIKKGITYRLFSTSTSEYSFSIKVKSLVKANTIVITNPTYDKYKNYVDFKLLDVLIDSTTYETIVVYELDGARKEIRTKNGIYDIRTYIAQFDAKTGEVYDISGLFNYEVVNTGGTDIQIEKSISGSYSGEKFYFKNDYGTFRSYYDFNNVYFKASGDTNFAETIEGKIVEVKVKEGYAEEIDLLTNVDSKITKLVWKKTFTPNDKNYKYYGLEHIYVSGDYTGDGTKNVTASYKLPSHYELTNTSWQQTDTVGNILISNKVDGKNYLANYRSNNEIDISNIEAYYTCYAENVDHAFRLNDGAETIVDVNVEGGAISPIFTLIGKEMDHQTPYFTPDELEVLKNAHCTILWKETSSSYQYSFKPIDEFDPNYDMNIYFICVDTDNKKIRRIWIAFDKNAWYYDEILFATLADLENKQDKLVKERENGQPYTGQETYVITCSPYGGGLINGVDEPLESNILPTYYKLQNSTSDYLGPFPNANPSLCDEFIATAGLLKKELNKIIEKDKTFSLTYDMTDAERLPILTEIKTRLEAGIYDDTYSVQNPIQEGFSSPYNFSTKIAELITDLGTVQCVKFTDEGYNSGLLRGSATYRLDTGAFVSQTIMYIPQVPAIIPDVYVANTSGTFNDTDFGNIRSGARVIYNGGKDTSPAPVKNGDQIYLNQVRKSFGNYPTDRATIFYSSAVMVDNNGNLITYVMTVNSDKTYTLVKKELQPKITATENADNTISLVIE